MRERGKEGKRQRGKEMNSRESHEGIKCGDGRGEWGEGGAEDANAGAEQ